jgi:hypothetical protein
MSNHSRLGGTSIAALLGEDSFGKTPRDIYNQIINGARGFSSVPMRRGTAMEPRVRRRYVEEQGAELLPHPGVVHWGKCFAASVDDIRERAGNKGPVDYKTASASDASLRKWSKGMLSGYAWQLRLYMAVFSLEEADLFVAFGKDLDGEAAAAAPLEAQWTDKDGTLRAFEITGTQLFTLHRDLEQERRMITVGEEFWNAHIIPRIPPGPELPPPPAPTRIAVVELSAADLSSLEALNGFETVDA